MTEVFIATRLIAPQDRFGWFAVGYAHFKYRYDYYQNGKVVYIKYISYLPPPPYPPDYIEGEVTMANTIATAVAEQIKGLGPQVEAEVVEALVDRELKRRSEALVNAIDKLAKLENEQKRIKPDITQFDAEGKEISATFSKTKFEELKKSREQIAKITAAINKALEKADFNDVYNLAKSGGSDGKPAQDKSSGDDKTE